MSLRPWQWTKNLLVFFPLIFSLGERWSLSDLGLFSDLLARSVIVFLLLCALSGAIYIINDVFDCAQDRLHPRKRKRPIASGVVPLPVAKVAAGALLATALVGSFLMGIELAIVAFVYLALNFMYSSQLKHVVILDVMVLSAGFILRVISGSFAIDVMTSPWLYTTVGLCALTLSLGKRYSELQAAGSNATNQRSVLGQYSTQFLSQLLTITSTATVLGYALYTFSASNVPQNHSMMLTVPFVLFGLFRYLFVIGRTDDGESPELLLMKDRPLLIDIMLWGVTAVLVMVLNR